MLCLAAIPHVICEAQSHFVPGKACRGRAKLRTSYRVDDTNYPPGIRVVYTMTSINILSERLIYPCDSTSEHTKCGSGTSDALELFLVFLLTRYRINLVPIWPPQKNNLCPKKINLCVVE